MLGLIDLQVNLLVELGDVVRHAVGQKLSAHDHEQPVVAGAVIDQSILELGRHERRVSRFRERVAEQLEQLIARGSVGHKSRTDPCSQRNEMFLSQHLYETAVSREDHRQQRRGIEVGAGKYPQLG